MNAVRCPHPPVRTTLRSDSDGCDLLREGEYKEETEEAEAEAEKEEEEEEEEETIDKER
jgi:hypothetical protein